MVVVAAVGVPPCGRAGFLHPSAGVPLFIPPVDSDQLFQTRAGW